jgi:hypothetical protein
MPDTSPLGGRFSEGDLRIGQGLGRTWSVFSGNFLKFSVVTGIAALSISTAVTYHDLRVAKEGVDTRTIAAVFE